MFHYRPTKKELDSVRRYNTEPLNLKVNNLREGTGDFWCRFQDHVRDTKAPFVVIIGHNDKGRFYFADGSSKPLSTIIEFCEKNRKKPILLSCRAKDYSNDIPAARRDLTYSQAFEIATRISDRLGHADAAYSLNDVNTIVQGIIDEKQLHGQVQLAVVGAGATAIIATVVGYPSDDESKEAIDEQEKGIKKQ